MYAQKINIDALKYVCELFKVIFFCLCNCFCLIWRFRAIWIKTIISVKFQTFSRSKKSFFLLNQNWVNIEKKKKTLNKVAGPDWDFHEYGNYTCKLQIVAKLVKNDINECFFLNLHFFSVNICPFAYANQIMMKTKRSCLHFSNDSTPFYRLALMCVFLFNYPFKLDWNFEIVFVIFTN